MSRRTLKSLMDMQAAFDAAHGDKVAWGEPIRPNNLGELEHGVVCLAGEVGEFANEVKKIVRGDVPFEGGYAGLREELTDVFIYLMKLCNQLGIDLEKAYLEKLAVNRERFRSMEKK